MIKRYGPRYYIRINDIFRKHPGLCLEVWYQSISDEWANLEGHVVEETDWLAAWSIMHEEIYMGRPRRV